MGWRQVLFVSAGARVQLGREAMSARRGLFAGVATVTLAAGIVPSTVSHLSDGSRFDYRPAFQFIRTHGSDVPVVTWPIDRKSTRLNSSHLVISYAVFCLKKKKKKA